MARAMSSLDETIADKERDASAGPPLDDPSLFFNRELSWLQFNDRVLQLAEQPRLPLLERAKFCAIWTSNLDEFFQVRVAGLHDQVDAGLDARSADGLTASEVIDRIRKATRDQGRRLTHCLEHDLRPALAEHDISIVAYESLSKKQRKSARDRFQRQIFPALTPLAVGPARPFPYISDLSLSLAVLLRDPVTDHTTFARVKVPKEMLPRFLALNGGTFVPLEDVIASNLDALFPGMEILDHSVFRVTRDGDFEVSDEADDLVRAVEDELRRRRFGEVVRLEVAEGMHPALRERLVEALEVEERQVYEIDGLLDLTDLWELVKLPGFQELRESSWTPVTQPRLQFGDEGDADIFSEMRKSDILVHHPYDSFATSVERFIDQAVNDPDVLAIKMTVYRTSDDSPLVPALIRATERGKQAVCLVELKARFDERANLQWARSLEQSGVHVTYGIPALKTHAKALLVVRREGKGVRNYVHIGTGNYHPTTARLYTDFGLFTTDERIGRDVNDMFN